MNEELNLTKQSASDMQRAVSLFIAFSSFGAKLILMVSPLELSVVLSSRLITAVKARPDVYQFCNHKAEKFIVATSTTSLNVISK